MKKKYLAGAACLLAALALPVAATAALAAPAAGYNGWIDQTKDYGPFQVHVQAETLNYNGTVTLVGQPQCTLSGFSPFISVSWCGGNPSPGDTVTVGYNIDECVGPFGVGCILHGGGRWVTNAEGNLAGSYFWA